MLKKNENDGESGSGKSKWTPKLPLEPVDSRARALHAKDLAALAAVESAATEGVDSGVTDGNINNAEVANGNSWSSSLCAGDFAGWPGSVLWRPGAPFEVDLHSSWRLLGIVTCLNLLWTFCVMSRS